MNIKEPVATVRSYNGLVGFHANQKQINILKDKHEHPLYLHPAPSWQGLESEKVTQIIHGLEDKLGMPIVGAIAVARAIEQALKERNT